jgi:hypothetical protein
MSGSAGEQLIDVMLSLRRDLGAARRFFTRVLRAGTVLIEITTDRAPVHPWESWMPLRAWFRPDWGAMVRARRTVRVDCSTTYRRSYMYVTQ